MSRAMLLPTPTATAQKVSLHNHMALAALRQGRGNIDLAGELLKTVFLTYRLANKESLAADGGSFVLAESIIKAMIIRASNTHEWRLDDEHCEAIEQILRAHDADLATLPVHRIDEARRWLVKALESGSFPVFGRNQQSRDSNDG